MHVLTLGYALFVLGSILTVDRDTSAACICDTWYSKRVLHGALAGPEVTTDILEFVDRALNGTDIAPRCSREIHATFKIRISLVKSCAGLLTAAQMEYYARLNVASDASYTAMRRLFTQGCLDILEYLDDPII